MASAASRAPYLALAHRDYRRLIASQLLSLTGTQMQVVAINWHVYLLTRSPLALGFVGLTRVVPIVIFSLWGGVVADHHDRRRVMIVTQIAMTAVALGLAAITFARGETLGLLYLLNALGAAAVAFDGPSRQALIPRLVPPEDLPGALSLNLSVFQAALIGGPALAGIFIARAGPGTRGLSTIYLLNALSFLAVIFALATMRTSGAPEPAAGKVQMGSALAEGLRFVFKTPLMVWTMGLDFLATFFAGAMSLLPIFADQVLHVAPEATGFSPRRRPSELSPAPSFCRSDLCPSARAASFSGPSRPTAGPRSSSACRATSGSRSRRWRESVWRTRSRRSSGRPSASSSRRIVCAAA